MSAEIIQLPLTVAAARVQRSLDRLSQLAETAPDAAFEAELREWFGSMRAFGAQLQSATGLSAKELAEALVP